MFRVLELLYLYSFLLGGLFTGPGCLSVSSIFFGLRVEAEKRPSRKLLVARFLSWPGAVRLLGVFLPQGEVYRRDPVAVQELRSLPVRDREHVFGHPGDVVPVVAEDSRQGTPPEFGHLLRREGCLTLVPEPVTVPDVRKLTAEEAEQRRTHFGALNRLLADGTHPEVHVLWCLVEALELVPELGACNLVLEVLEASGPREVAELPPAVVARKAVISTPLNVERG